ncbi:flagellin [Vibrio coralliirubri]|uniref:flagellin n=1 Tax=Vibrio coralliirubri TaxID=1516159 RepID=UPI0022845709|nr:flagellin [Vibrio coralliirubri]MCY9860998.1 flagellin [Vibrio coralliirubri]
MLSINTNLNANQAATQIGRANQAVQASSEKLTTGMAINKAADDVSGAALANRLANNSAKTAQFIKNANDGVNMIQAADNAIKQQQDLVARMQELAYKAENGTNTTSDTDLIQKEFDQLAKEIVRNEKGSEFNGKQILDGTLDAAINVGTGSDNQINVGIENDLVISGGLDTTTGGDVVITVGGLDVTTTIAAAATDADVQAAIEASIAAAITAQEALVTAGGAPAVAAEKALTELKELTVSAADGSLSITGSADIALTDDAGVVTGGKTETARESVISDDGKVNVQLSGHTDGDTWKTEVHDKLDSLADKYNSDRADLGAAQNRIEFATKNLEGTKQNIDSTLSAAQDTDFASETAELAKSKVLAKTSQTMLSQANKSVEEVTSLLQ